MEGDAPIPLVLEPVGKEQAELGDQIGLTMEERTVELRLLRVDPNRGSSGYSAKTEATWRL